MIFHVTVLGPPRTLKTHNQAFIRPGGDKGQPCPYCKRKLLNTVLPSEAYVQWVKTARILYGGGELVRAKIGDELATFMRPNDGSPAKRLKPLEGPMNCAALFYRDALRGDAVGFVQGLYDLMQHWGIIADDKWLVQGDGTRLLLDRVSPRVEVTLTALTPLQDEAEQLTVGLPDQNDEPVAAPPAKDDPPWT